MQNITGELNYFLSQTKNNRNKNKNEGAQNVDKQKNDKNILSEIENCASFVCYLSILFAIILPILVFASKMSPQRYKCQGKRNSGFTDVHTCI
jgi:hypothetical protein